MADGIKYHVAKELGENTQPNADGSFFQLAIAVDLNNRKMEYGSVIKYSLAADELGVSSVAANAKQFGVSHTNQNSNSCPSQFIQYGDHAVVGPSSVTGQEGYSEAFRVAGSGHLNDSDANSWTQGQIITLDRKTKYQYQLSDPLTIYGTGRAAGWYIENMCGQTVGTQKGFISLNGMGRFIAGGGAAHAHRNSVVTSWEHSFGTASFHGVKVKTPNGGLSDNENDYVLGYSTGPLHASAKGPSRRFSRFALMSLRVTTDIAGNGNWSTNKDWFNDAASGGPNSGKSDCNGAFRYVHKYRSGTNSEIAMSANIDLNQVDSDQTIVPLMMGFDHPGGQYSDTSQAFMTCVNGLSTSANSRYNSTGIFYQPLTRSVSDELDGKFSKLVGRTNYRMGITYRGNMTDESNSVQNSSYSYAFFQWSSGIRSATHNDNTYTDYYMSTNSLLDGSVAAKRDVNSWTTEMVSAYVENPNVDIAGSKNYQAIGVVQVADIASSEASTRYEGTDMMTFIDNMWLEHQGDIEGATGKGYCELAQHPEQGTLKVDRHRTNKPVALKLSDGSRKTLDTTGTNQKYLHTISCDFLYLKQADYQKFQGLLRWQDLGHKLTLHPHLPEVPDCLVGELEISNVRKSFWDLTRFSLSFKFIETD